MSYENKKLERITSVLIDACSVQERVANMRLAACVVYKGDIVSLGWNQKKSHPFQMQFAKNDMAIYLHAEIDCIKNALKILSLEELRRSTMFVLRAKADLSPGLAKPCEGCTRCIANFNIRECYYTTGEKNYQFKCL